jgi:hypothetical protein
MMIKRVLYGQFMGNAVEARCRIPVSDETDESIADVSQEILIDAVFRATGNQWSEVTESAPIPDADGKTKPRLRFNRFAFGRPSNANRDREIVKSVELSNESPTRVVPHRSVRNVVFASETDMIVLATDGTLWELCRRRVHIGAEDGDYWKQLPELPQPEIEA